MANTPEKNTSQTSRVASLKEKLSFETIRQPAEIKKMKTRIIIRTIVVEFLFSILSFSLQGAKTALEHNWIILSIVLLALYFAERVIETAYSTYDEYQQDEFNKLYTSVSTELIMVMTSLCRNKVYKKNENNTETVMAHPELIKKSKDYIDSVWRFWWTLPLAIAQIITLAVMTTMTFIMELNSGSLADTSFVMFLLLLCMVIYFIFGKKRIDVMKQFRKKRKENETVEEVLYSEIKTIEFASTRDFLYHADRLRKHLASSKDVLKTERFKMNSVFITRSFVSSAFMIAILVYKVWCGKEFNIDIFVNVVAISTVYSTILGNIRDIIKSVEDIWDFLLNIDNIYPDFKSIDEVYNDECRKNKIRNDIASKNYEEIYKIKLGEFTFSYDKRNNWSLISPNPFELLLGEVVLVQGETGCGKTTALNVLNGNVRMPESPIFFSNGEMGYLNTLTYHTDRAVADNYILSEIILSDDYSNVDKDKLLEIIDGLALKDMFLTYIKHDKDLEEFENDDERILEFMKHRTFKQFSSGQQQRIALAKLLYTLDESVQAICLDEAFNRLNDEIAEKCVQFIIDFVQRDRKRLVLIATHQLIVIRKYCSKEISFEVSEDGTSTIKLKKITC